MKNLVFLLAFFIGFSTKVAAINQNKIVAIVLLIDNGTDKKVITTIYTTFMAAEKVAQDLNVKMVASDDPIAEDVFVFPLNSIEQKDLAMKMFDEEGYETVGGTALDANESNGYKPIDVKSLEEGSYIFEIQEDEFRVGCGCSCIRIKRD